MKRGEPEHLIQCAFINWVRWNENLMPALQRGFAVPNGGGRSKAQAGKLKAEGVRPGVPDWLLPVAAGECIGFAIEFKAPKKHPSPAQKDFIAMLRGGGWLVVICYTPDSAIEATKAYLAKLTPEQRTAIVRGVHVT